VSLFIILVWLHKCTVFISVDYNAGVIENAWMCNSLHHFLVIDEARSSANAEGLRGTPQIRNIALEKACTHTHTQPFYCWSGICPGPPGSAGTRKVTPRRLLDLLEQEIVSGSGICWSICKSAPHADNHANIPPLSLQ